MSIFLQNPALLGLLALAGLPALVHLISRAKPPEYRFSNIDFLRRVIRRTARVRRPKDWLLLLLRTLALAAVAFAFASPLLISEKSPLPGEKSTAVIIIDRSASMAAREGAGSRFEAASAAATEYLEASDPAAANLVWIDAEPSAAFPEPGPNITYLTDTLKTSEPKPESGALNAAFDLALRQLSAVKGRRQLVIISDFQASAWRDFSPALPSGIEVLTRNVATAAPPNFALTRLLAQPAGPVVGQETTVLANVRNFSPEPVRTQLTLDADGSRQSQAIELPPWGEVETAFSLRPAGSGSLPVSASIDADSFLGDNSRHTVIKVRDAIRVALPEQESPSAKVLEKVVSALPWLERSQDAAPGDILVHPADAPGENLKALAESGVTILLESPTPQTLAGILEDPSLTASTETNPTGWQILPDEGHSAIRIFHSGDFGNPFAGVFRERLRLPVSLTKNPRVRTIAIYADGIPAIFEITTSGAPVLAFNLSLDPAKSGWATQGAFLPAFAEILLRTRPAESSEAPHHPPGSPLHYVSADAEQSGALELIGPGGTAAELVESTSPEGIRWQASSPAIPGLHRWQISGQTIAFSVVNFPESESDLRPMETAPTFDGTASATDSFARQAALARGVPLWPWLVAAALGFLMLESLIHIRQSRPASA